jgi:hypothetical protein
MSDEMIYAYLDTVVRLDRTVIEVFRQQVIGSHRTPLLWAGADVQLPKPGGQIKVTIGTRGSDGFYNTNVTSNGAFTFTVPPSEEPRLRLFLDEAQARSQQPAASGS